MNKNVKEGYNKSAEAYAEGRDKFKNLEHLEKFNDLLKPKSKILDIGCGSGVPITSYLVEQGHEVAGIDISEKQIEMAKRKVSGATFEVKDMSNLRSGEYKVDAVVSFYAVFHIPKEEHKYLFEKIHSFLNPGGLMMVTMGETEWEGSAEDFYGAQMHWSHYGRDKNIQIVSESGFEIVLDEILETGGERHQVIIARKN